MALTCADPLWQGSRYTDQSIKEERRADGGRVADAIQSDQYTAIGGATLLGQWA
jgi:hypothetical protein